MFQNISHRWKTQKPAESLVEVVIAVFVVALGSGAATSLIINAIQANSFSKDSLVALNLAVEGIEAMRDIRDTNWIKFGYDKANCWNVLPGSVSAPGFDCTAAANKIGVGAASTYYSVDLNPTNYSWSLPTKIDNALDLSTPLLATNDRYRLGFVDLNGTGDKDIYVTAPFITSTVLPTVGFAGSSSGDSKFYRMIEISYDGSGDPATAPLPDVMNVTSTVQWLQNGVHTVELSISLSNYQKVPTS